MPILLISYVIQALLIVHCIKTGRNQLWIWVLAMLPVASILAYTAAELVPDLLRSRATQRTVKGVKKALNPEGDLRRLAQHAEISGGVDASQRHAEELMRLGRPAEAATVYQRTLKGLYEHDPNLLLGLARAQFTADDAAAARATLDTLIKHNPEFRSADGHLLYARALEQEGQQQRALDEYRCWPATTRAPKGGCAMPSCCARWVSRTRRASSCGSCSTWQRWRRRTIGAHRKIGSSRRSGKSPHSEGSS